MAVFVKSHRRGRSLIRAYARNTGVGQFKMNHDLNYGSNKRREDRIILGLAKKVARGNAAAPGRRHSSQAGVFARMYRKHRSMGVTRELKGYRF